jgi:hypothetical protein
MTQQQMVSLDDWCHWTERQADATAAADTHRYTLYGGSKGPGKSYWLRKYPIRYLVYAYAQLGLTGVRAMLACEDYPTLNDRHISKVKADFPNWLGTYNGERHEFTLAPGLGGGILCFRNLDDPKKYKGAEFACIAVDELTMNGSEVFDMLWGCLRWPGPSDNPYLSASYWEQLKALPPQLYRAWVNGDWDVFEGQCFAEFSRDVHVKDPVEIPVNWPKWRSVDWGFAKPFGCLWITRNPDTKQTVFYREAYQKGLTDPEQAEMIVEMTPKEERIQVSLADPSMWTERSLERQTVTSAQVYERHGVRLKRADNDRILGVRKMHDALKARPVKVPTADGEGVEEKMLPGLVIFSTCQNLIRTLPSLPYDTVHVEDVDTDAEDHLYDCARYGLMWKAWGAKRRRAVGPDDYWGVVRHA